MRHPRRRLPIAAPALAAAAMAVLAACGGSSSSSKGASSSNSVASTVKATKGGDFCKQIASTYNEALSFTGANAGSPDQLRQELEKSLKDGRDVIDNAPSEVKGDLQVIQDGVQKFADALAKVNYDATKLGPDAVSVLGEFNTPQFQQAATHSQAYVKDHCGIDLGAAGGGTVPGSPTSTP
ncbi:MAG TPA: hypothetical protein VHS52_03820 [Acidimicrobiales bacterium]|nr:hypothetical protein [Acidimicrobiales bacterium]